MSGKNKSIGTAERSEQSSPYDEPERGSLLGSRETKIAMALISILLIVFGVVLYNRLTKLEDGTSTETAQSESPADTEPDKAQKPAAPTSRPKLIGGSLVANKPASVGKVTVQKPKSPAGATLKKPENMWSSTSSYNTTPQSPATTATASSPPSIMPKQPVAVTPSGRYGGYTPTPPPTTSNWNGSSTGYPDTRANPTQTGAGYSIPNAPMPGSSPDPLSQDSGATQSPSPDANPLRGQTGGLPAASRYKSSYNTGSSGYADVGDYAPSGTSSYRNASQSNYPTPSTLPEYTSTSPSTARLTDYAPSPEAPPADGTYVVQPNDSYWNISKRFYGIGAYYKALAEHNLKTHPDEDALQIGDEISLPDADELAADYPGLCPSESDLKALKHRMSTVSTRVPYGGGRQYVVQSGDNLSDIAHYELGSRARIAEIIELNREALGPNINLISPGMKLILPSDEPVDMVTERPAGRRLF